MLIGIYKNQPVKIIESCIPSIEKQIRDKEYKTTCNNIFSNERYNNRQKQEQHNLELGDFSASYIKQIKYNESKLKGNEPVNYLSTPYERYWFNEGGYLK